METVTTERALGMSLADRVGSTPLVRFEKVAREFEGIAVLGKAGTRQSSMAGFETEDILYLLPLVTVFNGLTPFLVAASIGAPLFALWVIVDFRRVLRRQQPLEVPPTSRVA